MTPFCFDHVFRAPSPAEVFRAYFDEDHGREQDRRLDLLERTILERTETDAELLRVCRVVPKRQLPAIVRPLLDGPLHYVETARWHKDRDLVELDIRPSLGKGRAVIRGTYQLTVPAPGQVQRRHEGTVSVEVPLLGPRIERSIVAELDRSQAVATAWTQEWLDRRGELRDPSVTGLA